MTIKNKTKTILCASLIVAMILPFSGMNFVQVDAFEHSENTDPITVKNKVKIVVLKSNNSTIQINWDIGDFPERIECLMKTEIKSYDDVHKVSVHSFGGKNQTDIVVGSSSFYNANLNDMIVDCSGEITMNIGKLDFVTQNEYYVFTTFAVLIDDQYTTGYINSHFLASGTNNILLMNEAEIQYSMDTGYIFERVSCVGSMDLVKFTYLIIDVLGKQKGEITHDMCNSFF